jgi:hypothetical protein
MSKPAITHREAAKQALCYLAGIKNIGLIFGAKPLDNAVHGYTDFNFTINADN